MGDIPASRLREGQTIVRNSAGDGWNPATLAGQEIGYAENTAGQASQSNLITSPVDMSGLQITIPANTPDYVVELFMPALQVGTGASWTSGNGQPVGEIQLVDEGAVVLGTSALRMTATAASQTAIGPVLVRKRMLGTAAAKTIKAQSGLLTNATNITYVWFAGPGNLTANGGFAPAYLQAYTR